MSNPYAPPSPGRQDPGTDAGSADAPDGSPASERPRPPQHGVRPPAPPRPVPPLGMRPRPAPEQPAPPAPDPETMARTGRLVRHFGIWLVAGVAVGAMLPLPWRLASVAFLVGAAVAGVRALRAVVRARMRGGLVPMLAVGLAMTAVLAFTSLASLVLLPADLAQQDCLEGALTQSAKAQCARDYQDALEDLQGSLTRP